MDAFKAILVCLLVFTLVFVFMWIKVDAYGGDVSCLFVRCVKVIR
jgi:hypothetical protein